MENIRIARKNKRNFITFVNHVHSKSQKMNAQEKALIKDMEEEEEEHVETVQVPFDVEISPNTAYTISFDGKEQDIAFLMHAKVLEKKDDTSATLFVKNNEGKKIPIAEFKKGDIKGKDLDYIIQKDHNVTLISEGNATIKVSGIYDNSANEDAESDDEE